MEKFKNNVIKIFTNIKYNIKNILGSIPKPFLGIIFAIFVLLSPLLDDKIAWGHDYSFHATNFILNSNNSDLILPKIFGGNIANGFGYGTGIFYPPLSYYITTYISYFLNLFNLNISLSITCIEILITLVSGIVMYKFLERIFKDNKIAGIGSISYISSTYYLSNIYTRCSIGEMLTFVFVPIIFWGLYELFFGDNKKFNLLFIIGYVGMIHSHLVLSVYLTIIIILLFLCFPNKVLKKDKIKPLFTSSIIILLLSSPYLVPLIEHKILGNYVVFEPYSMYSIEWIKYNSLEIKDFFTIGIVCSDGVKVYINHIVLIIFIIIVVFNKKIFTKENRTIYKITILIIIISAFISSSYFPWDKMPTYLKMIQFPWRLCGLTSFGLSVLVGNIVKLVKGENKILIITGIALGILLFGFNSISQDKITEPSIPYDMSMGLQKEYLPSNTLDNINYFNNRNQDIIVKEGNAEISITENHTPYLKSEIVLKSDTSIIELPRLYYLGYSIKMIDNDGNVQNINYIENENGFIELEIKKSGILEVSYEGTIANKIVNYIFVATIIIYISVSIFKTKNKISIKSR